ncbi:MAG: hypothetical protein EG826_09385 [Deltaproteobacteria bacterium]|nr:hypothetical protein [Deltaproteobacteria bacterium]
MSKATMKIKLRAAILLVAFSISGGAAAQEIKIEDANQAYVTKRVTAENVQGVEVRLFKEILAGDCNTRTLSLSSVRVFGDGSGWHDRYFFDAGMLQTAMFCPSDKRVRETIYSQPVFLKSFTNENVHRKVAISIVIPDGYQLDVRAVK